VSLLESSGGLLGIREKAFAQPIPRWQRFIFLLESGKIGRMRKGQFGGERLTSGGLDARRVAAMRYIVASEPEFGLPAKDTIPRANTAGIKPAAHLLCTHFFQNRARRP
jgi:hypothetical protein